MVVIGFVCCSVAFRITSVCILHACCAFVFACVLVLRVIVDAFAFVSCKVRFQIPRMCVSCACVCLRC